LQGTVVSPQIEKLRRCVKGGGEERINQRRGLEVDHLVPAARTSRELKDWIDTTLVATCHAEAVSTCIHEGCKWMPSGTVPGEIVGGRCIGRAVLIEADDEV